jgi:hypothetical protein
MNYKMGGVGNPGIGKTSNTLYLLKKLIVDHKAPIVYTIREPAGSSDIFYEFVPVVDDEKKVNDITVNVYQILARDKEFRIPSMKNRNAFYVVDPGDFEGSYNDAAASCQKRDSS